MDFSVGQGLKINADVFIRRDRWRRCGSWWLRVREQEIKGEKLNHMKNKDLEIKIIETARKSQHHLKNYSLLLIFLGVFLIGSGYYISTEF